MRHVTYKPDCPECGREMGEYMSYVEGSETPDNPFGRQERWWECSCGHTSERVPSTEFAALTDKLTAPLREADHDR